MVTSIMKKTRTSLHHIVLHVCIDPAAFCLLLSAISAQAHLTFAWLVEEDHVIVYCLLYLLPIPEYMNLLAFKVSARRHVLLKFVFTEFLGVDLRLQVLLRWRLTLGLANQALTAGVPGEKQIN